MSRVSSQAKQERPVSVCGAVRVATEVTGESVSESTIRIAADRHDLPSTRLDSGQRIFEPAAVRQWALERAERRAR